MADPKIIQQLLQNQNFRDAVSLGLIDGIVPEVKFGHNPNISTGVRADVWENGPNQAVYLFPDAAGESIEVFAGGTDTVNITIQGLDATGATQSETVALSGTGGAGGAVAVPGTWRAVNRAYNADSVELASQVTVRKVGDAARVYALVDIDDQQTSQAIYQVPAGKVAMVNNYSTAVNKSGGATLSCIFGFRIKELGNVFRTQIRYGLQRTGTSNISSDLIVPVFAGPLAQMKVSATPDANTTDTSAEFSMWLIDVNLLPAAFVASLAA